MYDLSNIELKRLGNSAPISAAKVSELGLLG